MLSAFQACCCAGEEEKIWSAARCSPIPCSVEVCTPSSCGTPSCPAIVTFCDEHRANIGLPPELDPSFCYLVASGGCLFVVSGYSLGVCNPATTPTHNNVALYAIKQAPTPPATCLGDCAFSTTYHVSDFVPFNGGMACKTSLIINANWSIYCNGECDGDPGVPTNDCAKRLSALMFEYDLGVWPNGLNSKQSKCDNNPRQCVNCIEVDPLGTATNVFVANDQVQDNQCNALESTADPCDSPSIDFGPACAVFATAALNIVPYTGTAPATIGLTITKSCNCDGTGEWAFGSPDSGIQIGGCFFAPNPCGTDANAFAEMINAVLGSSPDPCAVTYSASGSIYYMGIGQQSCPTTTCSDQLSPFQAPYQWLGPYFSNGNCTATWYAVPTLAYQLELIVQANNLTFFDEDGVPTPGCRCTGSPLGGFTARFLSNEVLIEVGNPVTPSMLVLFDDPFWTNPPCVSPPTVS